MCVYERDGETDERRPAGYLKTEEVLCIVYRSFEGLEC